MCFPKRASCGVEVGATSVCILPRLFAPLATPSCCCFMLLFHISELQKRSTVSFQSTWPTVKQSQTARKVSGNLQNQTFKVKYSGFIHWVSKLIICREATPRHQQTASPSQKPTSTSNTAVSQAVLIQKQSHPGSTDTFLPSSKQHPRRQKSMCPHCFSYHVVALTWLRHHNARKPSTNHPHPLENRNEGKKNKNLDIPHLEPKSSLLRSDCKPRLRAVLTRKNHIRCRRGTAARALTRSSTGSRLESGGKSTSNKIARSGKISKGASHQKNWDEGIRYRSITPESHSEKCTLLLIYLISLRGRSPPLPFAASNRNQPSKRLAINRRGKAKALNTILQSMKSSWSERVATCVNMTILMIMMIRERI